MRTAIIITGHMRTFARCVHSLRWHVVRHFRHGYVDFYVSTVADADAEGAEALLRGLFPGSRVFFEAVKQQPELPELPEPVRFEPYARSVPVQAVLRQLWQMEQGWWLYRRHRIGDETHVVRVRPDLFFHDCEWTGLDGTVQTPWWGRFGGVNDRFAIMPEGLSSPYFTAYSFIEEAMAAGCPLHPESLVRAACELRGVPVSRRLRATFTTLRHDGQNRPPEITPWDMAELVG
jgi:hypothetical protein